MKLTGWYSGDQKPARVGVYERLYDKNHGIKLYCFWDGAHFSIGYLSPNACANRLKSQAAPDQYFPWRGVAK